MSHYQWSRRNSNRASSRKKRRHLSLRSNSSFGIPEDEDDILQMYEEDGQLAGISDHLDTPESLVEKIKNQKNIIENVKFQPWHIKKKLQMLSLARSFVMKHEGGLSRGRGYQQKGQQLLKQVKRKWNNFKYWITPWQMRIKRIESRFGSAVASYFVFHRWLLWINLWLTIMQLCFVILPEMLVGAAYGTTERKTIPEDELPTAYDLKTIWDAEGVMRYSPLFYGYYGNSYTFGYGYRLPLAYLLITLVSVAYSFIVVLKKMASNSRQSRMSDKEEQFTFSWKLFTDWDYMVGNPETANTKHASIVTTVKEAIVEEQEKKQEERKYFLLFLRISANILVLILLAFSTYVIQLSVERSRELELKKLADKNYPAGFWEENELTLIMTFISTIFPNMMELVSLMEKYHPRTTLRLQLARIFLLNLLNLYTLFIALYNKQHDLKTSTVPTSGQGITNTSACSSSNNTVSLNSTISSTADTSSQGVNNTTCVANGTTVSVDICWETMIGQEVFKLTVMDLIFALGQLALVDVIRCIFVKYCNNICCWDLQKTFPEYPDFKIAENLLYLISNQGVIWLGLFFSPGLTILNLLKLLLLMYIRCWAVVVCNVPEERIFRASRSNNFYFALLLVMLFLCILPPLFAIVGVEPSPSCGPFSGLKRIYHVLTKAMETELPAGVNSVLKYIASPGVIVPVFMLLGMTIYYLVSIGRALKDANNELRMMLEYERTEGRKKMYAMGDAKRGTQFAGTTAYERSKMAAAVSLVLKATQTTRAMGAWSGMEQKRKTNGNVVRVNPKIPPAVRPKPQIPIAVVRGKRSLKRSTAALLNRAVARREHRQQQSASRQRVTGTNGRMVVTASRSRETPEVSSNEDDNESNVSDYSVHSSSSSTHRPSMMNNTGHLRPLSEDDFLLEMESDREEDTDYNDDFNVMGNEVGRTGPNTAKIPRSMLRQWQNAARPPVRSKPSRKIQANEIPQITVQDFGEQGMTAKNQNEINASGLHIEPRVVVQNEKIHDRRNHSDAPSSRSNRKI